MTTMSNSVRYFESEHSEAPVLSGAAGALIAVLDACLVNGYNVKTISTLVVVDGIVTATIPSGNPFEPGAVIRVGGSSPGALNGDWRIGTADANTVTWSVEGLGIADVSATGTITAMRAPAGWEKLFSDANRAAYRSLSHVAHNGLILYVDDSGTTTARIRGYESMSDIDTGTNPFPTDAQVSGGLWWGKAGTTGSSRKWAIAADAKRIIFAPIIQTVNPHDAPDYYFGRLVGADHDDLWATILIGATTSGDALSTNISSKAGGCVVRTTDQQFNFGVTIARSMDGLSLSRRGDSSLRGSLLSGSNAYALPAPGRAAGIDYPIVLEAIEGSRFHYRGMTAGCGHIMENTLVSEYPAFTKIGDTGNGASILGYQGNVYRWALTTGINGAWD